ncbi:MAG: phosphate propanoyltransferase [Candidatus Pacebacteria bacterium]|nr:phosphate propanoyltransferase [Candidatus Paceibacterota bacterium]
MKKIPIEISARHVHLAKEDLEMLFGKDYKLTKKKDLSQPGEFAANETVDIQKGDKKISQVRIVGPLRGATQVEMSFTDAFGLGVNVPVRRSGDVKRTPAICIIGPKTKIKIGDGAIVSWRHLHTNPEDAKELKIENRKYVSARVMGKRSLVFSNVRVRIKNNSITCLHIDTDEGNAAGIFGHGSGELILRKFL